MNTTTLCIILAVVTALALLYLYISIGFMISFFEKMVRSDEEGDSYATVFMHMLFKKSGEIARKYPGTVNTRNHPDYQKYQEFLQNIIISFWPLFAMAEMINYFHTQKEKEKRKEDAI